MATTYETNSYKDVPVVRANGENTTRWFSHTLASTNVINDLYKYFKLPQGAKLLPGWGIESPDLDSSTGITLTLRVTDGTTTKNVIVASTIGQAGGISYDHTATIGQVAGTMGFVTTNRDFRVELLIAAAASGTYTAGAVKVWASYTMDSEVGEGL